MAQKSSAVLFSHYADGVRPIEVVPGGWKVISGTGTSTLYTTAQSLLAELTGHPTGRHWSLDRYFGQGRYADNLQGQGSIFDLFPPTTQPVRPAKPLVLDILTLQESIKNTPKRVSRGEKKLGIDLVNRSHEVRKLLFAGFGRRIFGAGYDPEDVLQEVYRGLLARNKGKCPWDATKSSFGHYVHMVISCVLSNYHRKQNRQREFEQVGLPSYGDGERCYQDAANSKTPAPTTRVQADVLYSETVDDLVAYMLSRPARGNRSEVRLAVDVLPYITAATPRTHIASELGVSPAAVSRAVSLLRRSTLEWQQAASL